MRVTNRHCTVEGEGERTSQNSGKPTINIWGEEGSEHQREKEKNKLCGAARPSDVESSSGDFQMTFAEDVNNRQQ